MWLPHPAPTWTWPSLAETAEELGRTHGGRRREARPGRLTRAGLLCPQALRDASVLIFANKQDMKNSMTTVEISQFLTLSAIKDHPWHIQGCCALTGEGLVAAPPGPPGSGPTNEQLTIRTFSCFSPVRIWLTVSSWAKSVEHSLNS